MPVMEKIALNSTRTMGFIRPEAVEKYPALASHKPWPIIPMEERVQAAERLRERLSGVPLYAKGAAKARERGEEHLFWLNLQSSEMTAHRR